MNIDSLISALSILHPYIVEHISAYNLTRDFNNISIAFEDFKNGTQKIIFRGDGSPIFVLTFSHDNPADTVVFDEWVRGDSFGQMGPRGSDQPSDESKDISSVLHQGSD